jgi:hypothetical protein
MPEIAKEWLKNNFKFFFWNDFMIPFPKNAHDIFFNIEV